ncbi:MAG: hypothetical protein EU548_05710 [Promethearchaeota archaeon]|nr:MAG: hypothetical protein EU548_05710 [Candidatus Lokiarchaeota archaeon]
MPQGIFLYHIVEKFGAQIIADFYMGKNKVTPEILKIFIEKHTKKDLVDATYQKEDLRYYSSRIKSKSLNDELYLGFILGENEDLISLKSMFENIENEIVENYSKDKRKMQTVLKNIVSSVMSLMEKLKEPKIIQEKINEKTKVLLDDGKLQEARELIKLGETIPKELSQTVKRAEQYLKEGSYKKTRKYYEKAAELAAEIQEDEMVDILNKKAEQCEKIPDYIKRRENINKDITKILEDLEDRELDVYKEVIPLIKEDIKVSNQLEDNLFIEKLSLLKEHCQKASKKSAELNDIDKEILKILNDF